MGVVGFNRRTFQTWWAFPNLALYPLAIFVVWLLDTVFGLH